jgi:hypothetical protein
MLTPEMQKFAEEHYKLIFKFLYLRNLSENEFFDLAAIGYCKSVEYHFKNPKENYSFSTLAFLFMSRAISNYFKKLHRKKREGDLYAVSLDAIFDTNNGDNVSYMNVVSVYSDFSRLEAAEIWNELSENKRKSASLILQGYRKTI